MKNRVWIIIFSSLVLVCAALWLYISNSSSMSQIVGIYQNGDLVEKIDLSCVTQEREIKLTGEYGDNTILVSNQHIEMKSAQCPDKLCVKHGELINKGTPIVCLPNKIVIKFEDVPYDDFAKTGALL